MIRKTRIGDVLEMDEMTDKGTYIATHKYLVIAIYPFFVDCIRCDTGEKTSFTRGDLVIAGYEEQCL